MSKEAIEHYEAALKEAFPSGATGDVFHHWNEARKALAEQPAPATELREQEPLTDEQYFEIGQRHWLPSIKVEKIHKEIIEAAHGITKGTK